MLMISTKGRPGINVNNNRIVKQFPVFKPEYLEGHSYFIDITIAMFLLLLPTAHTTMPSGHHQVSISSTFYVQLLQT
jgi:hypothetical protein